jgi:hypothetical protein
MPTSSLRVEELDAWLQPTRRAMKFDSSGAQEFDSQHVYYRFSMDLTELALVGE